MSVQIDQTETGGTRMTRLTMVTTLNGDHWSLTSHQTGQTKVTRLSKNMNKNAPPTKKKKKNRKS